MVCDLILHKDSLTPLGMIKNVRALLMHSLSSVIPVKGGIQETYF
jgi:hypothetical protein